jgi:hypothetical protein
MEKTYDHSSDIIAIMKIRRLFFTHEVDATDLIDPRFQEAFSDKQIRAAGIIEELAETRVWPQPVRVPAARKDHTTALAKTGSLPRRPFQKS